MSPRVWVNSIQFSDQSLLTLERDDVVLLVGPNNSGKSAALRAIREKVENAAQPSPVVTALTLEREGTAAELVDWLEIARIHTNSNAGDPVFQLFGTGVRRSTVTSAWSKPNLPNIARFFCHLLTADERLQAANPASAIALTKQPPVHPIHALQRDDRIEARLSSEFRKAFGVDLIVHRNAGSQVPLYTGKRPVPEEGQDRSSYEYLAKLESLPQLETQGDGMRSFAGVLLQASVGRESILLIDEPEAFLHPPQARHLGHMLATAGRGARQLFLATHSGDFLRGVLDSNSDRVTVIRLRREGDLNIVSRLTNAQLLEVWSDPLLRFSNVLDGLFHEKVVVTEGDADARFYAAVLDALTSEGSLELDSKFESRRPDVMFTHGGGKARLPLIVRALRRLGVPVKAVADFDILNDRHPLEDLVIAIGGDWQAMKDDWISVKNAIDSKKPELSSEEVRKELLAVLESVDDLIFPKAARKSIQKILRRSSPWAEAKASGTRLVPRGGPTQACDRLLLALRDCGIFVVPVGELEGFVRSVGLHGPGWVNEVMRKDLKSDPELKVARDFVRALLGFASESGEMPAVEVVT